MDKAKVMEKYMWCIEFIEFEGYAVYFGEGWAARVRGNVVEEVIGLSL